LLGANPGARLLAGGTDLLVQMRAGRKPADLVIDIKNIAELNELSYDSGVGLTLGAAVPCYRIYGDAAVCRAYPSLRQVASLIGGTQIQGRASIGGNLCNAAPSADSIPLLIALHASCRIAGPQGERVAVVEDFCTAPGQNILGAGEMLVSMHVPAPVAGFGASYIRFIPRNEMDIAVAGAGVSVEVENGRFRAARVALASVAPTPLFVRDAGEWLEGKLVGSLSIEAAGEIAKVMAKPITDMRGTADYRRHLCGVLTRRALEEAIRRSQGVQ